jgi:hypothetical protein
VFWGRKTEVKILKQAVSLKTVKYIYEKHNFLVIYTEKKTQRMLYTQTVRKISNTIRNYQIFLHQFYFKGDVLAQHSLKYSQYEALVE